jgi:predicted transcriptional regulator
MPNRLAWVSGRRDPPRYGIVTLSTVGAKPQHQVRLSLQALETVSRNLGAMCRAVESRTQRRTT